MSYSKHTPLRVIYISISFCVFLLLPTVANAAADPVLTSIASAMKSKQITIQQAREYRGIWLASGSAALRAPTAQRKREVQAVRTYTRNLARRKQLTPARLAPVLLSVKATTYVMRYEKKFPYHEKIITIPGELTVFKYYSGRGVQWQPFESFKRGMELVNVPVPATDEARQYAYRMLELAVPRNGSLTWEYYFPFGGPSTPWISSLSQSLAVEFFHRTATQLDLALKYPEEEYIEDGSEEVTASDVQKISNGAIQALKSFSLSPTRGGVAVPQGSGRWYLIYPFARAQRVLNGHLQVLVNVSRYAADTNLPAAIAVVNAGVSAVVPLLPKFDTGGWSRYQYGQEANLNYHDFMTSQFKKLGAKTSTTPQRDIFQQWYERFSDYRITPPEITADPMPPAPIVPVKDGYRDTTTIKWVTDKRSRDTLLISSASGVPVRRLTVQGGNGNHSVTWDGRNSNGRAVPAGSYSISMDSVDIVGNRARTSFDQQILVIEDTAPPTVTSFQLIPRGSTQTNVRIVASDADSGYIDASVEIRGVVVAKARGSRSGTIELVVTKPLAVTKTAAVKLRDSSGNTTLLPLATPVKSPNID